LVETGRIDATPGLTDRLRGGFDTAAAGDMMGEATENLLV
jgi:hypothetical protein